MRKLPLVKYLKKQVAEQLDADGIFNNKTREIGIKKGQVWYNEMDTLIHEYIHYLRRMYPRRLIRMSDCGDQAKNETDKMARKICSLLVSNKYKKFFK